MSRGKKKLSKEQAIAQLWEAGDLSYKLRGVQLDMRDAVYNSKGRRTIFLCSRRLGKSYTASLIATETCLREPNQIVKFLLPKKKDAKEIASSHMRLILKDCPHHLKPEWKEADKRFVFPNGSEIQMAGTDGGSAESVRGTEAHLILMDEAGFMVSEDFDYIVKSILLPTTLTTNGKIIMMSTPSKDPSHPFMTDYVASAREKDNLVEYDIHSNPNITPEIMAEMLEEYPLGEEDPNYQREYLLRTNVANSLMVVPEWYDIKEDIVRESERPVYCDNYVSIDPAVTDGTGIIFGYYDFLRDKLVIEDELFLQYDNRSLTTDDIASGIIRKENNLFTNPYTGEVNTPYMRVSDDNAPLLLNDLDRTYGLKFRITKKRGKEDRINELRIMMKRGKIEINPRCRILIEHIRTAKWKPNRKEFIRNKGDMSKGIKPNHSDLLDALVYLVRNFHPHRNPYPEDYFKLQGSSVFRSPREDKTTKNQELMHSIMNLKGKNNN